MTRRHFSEIINYFHAPEEALLPQLEEETAQYPYSQTLWMLLAAGWALHDPLKFQQNLPKIAAIVPDRTQLKEVVSRSVNKSPLIIPVFSILETFIDQLEEIESDISDFMDEMQNRPQPKPQEITPVNSYDITKIFETEPEKNLQSDTKKSETLLLIDQFLKKQPTISRTTGEFFNPENVIEQSVDDSQQPVSETLAVILEKQGQRQKAIEIYQKLILENPEKSSYFAARIENMSNT